MGRDPGKKVSSIYQQSESGCMFTWGAGDFQLVSEFLKKGIYEMLLYMFVSEGNEGPGLTILPSS